MQLGEAIVVELDEIQPICTGTVMTCSYLTVKACPDGGNVVMCAWDGHEILQMLNMIRIQLQTCTQ